MRIAVAVLTAALLAGCAPQSVPGSAVESPFSDPAKVAGLPVTTGESGVRPGAPEPVRMPENTDGGAADRLAALALTDVEQYWAGRFPEAFRRDYEPVDRIVSFDSGGPNRNLCGLDTAGLVNAFYCPSDRDVVAWDRGRLLPSLGGISTVVVLAHEVGHAVSSRLGVNGQVPGIVKEQQADCYTGNFFRWVAEGRSARFQLSTGPGLNQVLATLFSIRDAVGTGIEAGEAHGTAFDRVTAFQIGFSEGPQRCAAIDFREIQRRSTQQVFGPGDEDRGRGEGNLRVDDSQALADLRTTLRAAFPGAEVRFDDTCRGSSPAAFCPGRVGIDLAALVRKSRIGDFAAFASVTSRYALAVQEQAGLGVEGVVPGLRTACLTGWWAATIVRGRGAALELSPGDLDEAVAELLEPDSLIAADGAGGSIPSGFARVDAFRTGFLSPADTCTIRFTDR